MGINSNLFNIDRQLLELKLEQLGERSSREILVVMREEANEIADLAKQFAPYDDGFLENAIEVVEDRAGINGRVQVYVQVNPTAVDDRGENVAKYAALQHELLAPFGSGFWNLRQGSKDKDAGRRIVGGKFMARAVKARQAIIGQRINQIARKIF